VDLRKLFRAMVSKMSASDKKLDALVQFNPVVANIAFTTGVRLFDYLSDPITMNLAPAKSQLTLFNYLPPTQASSGIQELENESLEITKLQLSESKRDAAATPSSALYLGGSCCSVDNVVTTLCNFRAIFLEYALKFDQSMLWSLCLPVVNLLASSQGKVWARAMLDHHAVPAAILNFVQIAFGRLVAQCQEETYIAAVCQSLPVSVDLFWDASTVMLVLERDLRTAIASHAAGNLGTWPTPVRLLLGMDAPSTGSKHTRLVSPVETRSKKVCQESKKDAAKPGQSPSSTEWGATKDSKLGMLEYYGPSTSAPPSH
jgi:hypothetical protein